VDERRRGMSVEDVSAVYVYEYDYDRDGMSGEEVSCGSVCVLCAEGLM
jgi:hypothetical protein